MSALSLRMCTTSQTEKERVKQGSATAHKSSYKLETYAPEGESGLAFNTVLVNFVCSVEILGSLKASPHPGQISEQLD